MGNDDRAARVAAAQHGIVTMQQALAAGMTRNMIEHRTASRRWTSVHPGVYRVAGAPPTWRGDLLAACLAAPGTGVASHRSAALLWGLPGGTDRLVEITCGRWRRAQLPRLVVHESGVLVAPDVTDRDGIPCMTVERTLLSLGAVLPFSVVELAFDAALHRNLTTIDDVRATVRRLGRSGRNGSGVLRRLVALHDDGSAVTESVMETRLKQLFRRRRLPLPEFQHEVRAGHRFVARVDAAYPDHHIAIEYDSFEHHTGRAALVRDSRRRNALVGIGWSVISVTAADISGDGDELVSMIRAALGRSGVAQPGYVRVIDAKAQ